jgi:LacI family transcriptional regulator
MFNSRVDGLLVSLAYDTKLIAHFEPFIQKNIPLIFFDRTVEHEKCPCIVIDNFKAGYDITKHLIENGCKHISIIKVLKWRNGSQYLNQPFKPDAKSLWNANHRKAT